MSKFVGAHVSASGGVFNAVANAVAIGAKAFALFTKNQRQWNGKELDGRTLKIDEARPMEDRPRQNFHRDK